MRARQCGKARCSGPKPSRYAEVELHRFGRRSSALDLPSSGCGLASSPKLGGRILGGAKIGGIPFAAGPCEASPISATGRRSLASRLLKASVDGTLCRGDRLRACLGPRTLSTAASHSPGRRSSWACKTARSRSNWRHHYPDVPVPARARTQPRRPQAQIAAVKPSRRS
jgi:hypothetical protein